MFDETTFNFAVVGFSIVSAVSSIIWQEIKPARKASEHNKPIQYKPIVAPKPKPPKVEPVKPVKPTKPQINPETLKAMHKQADAERGIAEALERKMLHTPDPIKHARLERQAANSWLRFNKVLDQIDKITMEG